VTYSNAQACQAFHEGITTGMPAADNNGSMTTTQWVQSQIGNATPALTTAINNWVTAWQNPSDTAQINSAQAAVQSICG
jgi:hypothetical protein